MMAEIVFKTHPRFNVLVSECGIVINAETGHIYKQHKTSTGYLRVEFRHIIHGVSRREKELTHRLVAETYIPNPTKRPEVDHRDRIRDNPHVSNLRWVSKAKNLKKRKWK